MKHISILSLVLLTACGVSQPYSGKLDIKDIKTVSEAVAVWQMDNFDRVPLGVECYITMNQAHWSSAVLYEGMYKWADWAGDARILDFLYGIGSANDWGLYDLRTPYHADDICVGQMYIDMYERYGEKKMIESVVQRASFIADNPSTATLSKKDTIGRYDRWSWCDALFMAPPVYAGLYRLTGEERYLQYMQNEFRECTDSLFDAAENLYYRDCIRRENREPNGKGEFWARGNAWVFSGIALMLDNLPATFTDRSYYEDIFRKMASSIVKCQDKNGSWHPSLLDPEHFDSAENSSSALFCYGLAWGINNNVIDSRTYLPYLKKGWKALCSYVQPDGKLGFVQPIGAFPLGGISADDTQVYAVGGFLMAASEICKMLDKPCLGQIVNKDLNETDNDMTLGCETLDRDYADYHKYKEYLEPLGIRRLRLQAGWAKTEKVKGEYDFAWLDSIVDDAVSRGLVPWIETSYGNPIYEGGGTPFLAGGWPVSDQAKAAWDAWVKAMATRYLGKVSEWEIWNEPDINKEQFKDYKSFVELTVRTARIIRSVDPDAKIAAFAWAYCTPELFDACLSEMKDDLDLIDWVTYHFYRYRPEDIALEATRLQAVLDKYSTRIKLRQGETGAPSVGRLAGALDGYDWTEVSQAKWDLRRMVTDKGMGIQTTVFTICDFQYSKNDHISLKNMKGLLLVDDDKNVIRPKESYWAVRNLATLWDEADTPVSAGNVSVGSSRHHSLYAFEDKETGLDSFVLWYDEDIPGNSAKFTHETIQVRDFNLRDPVAVDIRTGKIYKLQYVRNADCATLKSVPVYDSPVMVIDRSLLKKDL